MRERAFFSQKNEGAIGKKVEKTIPRLGKQPPRYRFFLNPYRDVRFSKCPQCSNWQIYRIFNAYRRIKCIL